jgi:hypothetical protein
MCRVRRVHPSLERPIKVRRSRDQSPPRGRTRAKTAKARSDLFNALFTRFSIEIIHEVPDTYLELSNESDQADDTAKICSYVSPETLLALTRSCKSLRSTLLAYSARSVWTRSIERTEGMPACPVDLSEPQYIALLFGSSCSVCPFNLYRP